MAEYTQGPRFLTVAEVADVMRVSRMTVYRMVHAGQIPAVRVGKSFRVPQKAVDDLIERGVGGWDESRAAGQDR